MTDARSPRLPRSRSLWFAGVTVLSGGVVAAAISLAILSSWSIESPPSALEFGVSGFALGAILGATGTVGALVGGWLAAAWTRRLALRAVGVFVSSAVLMLVLIGSLGVLGAGETGTGAVVLGVAALLTVSSVAPWRGGFARPQLDG